MGIERLLAGKSNPLGKLVARIINTARSNSLTPYIFHTGGSNSRIINRLEIESRLAEMGLNEPCFSPRQADLLIVTGPVNTRMASALRFVYDQMPEPKWVMALGDNACDGGIYKNYAVVEGAAQIIPVDVEVRGCPPSMDDIINGLEKLRKIIRERDLNSDYPQNTENTDKQ